MSDATPFSIRRPQIPGFTPAPQIVAENRFAEEALERHKREGRALSARTRIWAMLAIAILVAWMTPWPAVLYYEALILVFIAIGLIQWRIGTVGQNRWELLLLFCDLALLTIIAVVPNPLDGRIWPLAFQYKFETFIYFFVVLAGATLAYSWRTVLAVGTWTAALWTAGAVSVWFFSDDPTELREAIRTLYPDSPTMAYILDPTEININLRVQEIVVFLIVAATLSVSVRRFNHLLLRQAGLERERANLARYFSPNVVDQLSQNDEPLKQVREQDVAVLFVDIVGFTAYSDGRSPAEVIRTLREFHEMMEREVFRHDGTLDKYLGDGLMATFGTPFAGRTDACNALRCARAMAVAVDDWNATRTAAGQPAILASFGLHAGPVVLGDIGSNRLEFAVIGSTVNVASRLEAMSREMQARIVASDSLVARVREQIGPGDSVLEGLSSHDDCAIRGVRNTMRVWTGG